MYVYFMYQTLKHQFRSHIYEFNFFEVQNIHKKNKNKLLYENFGIIKLF
jgi:hypothetical protein